LQKHLQHARFAQLLDCADLPEPTAAEQFSHRSNCLTSQSGQQGSEQGIDALQ
jgi:hypothetical protein